MDRASRSFRRGWERTKVRSPSVSGDPGPKVGPQKVFGGMEFSEGQWKQVAPECTGSPGRSRSWGISEGWSHAASRASPASSSSSSSDTLSVGSWEDLAWQAPMQPSQAFRGQALTGHSLRALDFLAMPGIHKRSEKIGSQQGSTDHTEKANEAKLSL
ncbi:hypothetical protein AK812_SmicGene15718 [Symbiodinium microadriaticum]|uniref:Uncharacterized protein n=1 Tax=Symbiodinium microadriaticum TaxID=2951 RepID=A0A1Q9E2B1_SYMMI|nr:hypothetical protein AK812_SmicGene15718 [Symbiodinium microadriaticum]